MESYQDTKNYIYSLLNEAIQAEPNIKSIFIHGSFVTGKTSTQAFRDERFFLDNQYLFSIIKQVDASHDVDCFVISEKPETTRDYFNSVKFEFSGVYLTLNVITEDTLYQEVKKPGTTALKRIMLFKQIEVLSGDEIINRAKQYLNDISKEEYGINETYQKEFIARKKFLTILGELGVKQIKIERQFFDQFCPLITKAIAGEGKYDFPDNREKVVLPKPMGLKAKIQLSDLSSVELE